MGDRKAPTPFPGNQVRPSPPPAPPAPVTTVTNADYDRWLEQRSQLRDAFAKAALTGWNESYHSLAWQQNERTPDAAAIAATCYQLADAMLMARDAK